VTCEHWIVAFKIVAHSAKMPGLHAVNSRTKTNGGRCGNPRSAIDLGAFFIFPHARKPSGSSAANEIGELPAPVHTTNARAVAVVIKRFVGELRRCDHVSAFLHEFF